MQRTSEEYEVGDVFCQRFSGGLLSRDFEVLYVILIVWDGYDDYGQLDPYLKFLSIDSDGVYIEEIQASLFIKSSVRKIS